MSDLKLDASAFDDEHLPEDATEDKAERERVRTYVCTEITRYAVEILDYYTDRMSKNDSLALTIECLSECLGNLISLVHEDHQEEVILDSMNIIEQSTSLQQELIAEMAYGQIGHA